MYLVQSTLNAEADPYSRNRHKKPLQRISISELQNETKVYNCELSKYTNVNI